MADAAEDRPSLVEPANHVVQELVPVHVEEAPVPAWEIERVDASDVELLQGRDLLERRPKLVPALRRRSDRRRNPEPDEGAGPAEDQAPRVRPRRSAVDGIELDIAPRSPELPVRSEQFFPMKTNGAHNHRDPGHTSGVSKRRAARAEPMGTRAADRLPPPTPHEALEIRKQTRTDSPPTGAKSLHASPSPLLSSPPPHSPRGRNSVARHEATPPRLQGEPTYARVHLRRPSAKRDR